MNHAISGYFTCSFAYQQRLAGGDCRAGCFHRGSGYPPLGLFTEVNTASQAMRRDINKLLHQASSVTEAERRALTRYDAGDELSLIHI